MDFGVWVQNPNMTQTGETQTDRGDQAPPPTPPNGGPTNSGDPPQPLFSHQLEHPGVICDACNNGIFGFRYKCMKCVDFDLCCTCERRGLHAGHIMMRIPFPEMATEAIKRHITNLGSPETPFPFGQYDQERHPRCGRGGGGPHHEHRPDHSRGRGFGRRRHSHSSPESSDDKKEQAWCPYQMGRKEWKKWAKTIKKTAKVHKQSAEAYMRSGNGAEEGNPSTSAAAGGTAPPTQPPFDFTAAATHIQQFLNAFGVPIDVVELYDEWGNRGTPTSAPQATATAAPTAPPSGNEQTPASGNEQMEVPQTSDSTTQEAITEQFQDLSIRNETPLDLSREHGIGDDLILLGTTGGTRTPEDAEWTLVENNESGVNSNNVSSNASVDGSVANSELPGNAEAFPEPVSVERDAKVFRQIPIVPAETPVPTSASAPPTSPQQPIYPHLPPIMAPLVSGITNTIGNVTRNIPTLTWSQAPRGLQHQMSPQTQPQQSPELNEQMNYILNQLLSMGFSNHNGDLARLVAAKNGNLEDVLNSLFPPAAE